MSWSWSTQPVLWDFYIIFLLVASLWMLVTVFCPKRGVTGDVWRHAILTFHAAFAENRREKSPRVSYCWRGLRLLWLLKIAWSCIVSNPFINVLSVSLVPLTGITEENNKKSRPFEQILYKRAPVFLLSPGINTRGGTTLSPCWIYSLSRGLVSTNQTFFASEYVYST